MIKIENVEVLGWEHAIRGMRNPKNSWERSDSRECVSSCDDCDNFSVCNPNFDPYFRRFWEGGPIDCDYAIGPNDHKLMMQLADGGPVHAKYRRMITVYLDITAPLYFWKEFDTYKVGTVANSCSTMHKIADKEFTRDDFSHEHLLYMEPIPCRDYSALGMLDETIHNLNTFREMFLRYDAMTKNRHGSVPFDEAVALRKKYWWQMIQLLPSSYNQKRTVMLNYEVLHNMYIWRKEHKLDEWRTFCKWIETLPYAEIITGGNNET